MTFAFLMLAILNMNTVGVIFHDVGGCEDINGDDNDCEFDNKDNLYVDDDCEFNNGKISI